MQSAENLALAVHHGKTAAVERLVCAYQDTIYSYALRLLGNHFDAQEVAQDTFLKACRALMEQYDIERCRRLALRPWLFRITHNLSHNRLRARRREARNFPAASDSEHLDIQQGSARVAGRSDARELEHRLGRAMDHLRVPQREAILLRFMEEMSYAELASVMRISEAAARGQVFRGLQKLRKVMFE